MNIHIALYAFKPTVTVGQINKALDEVAALADKIPGIVEISVAENNSKYSGGYSHVILVRGENQEAIAAYRRHPGHQSVAQKLDAMEERSIGVDFETSSPG